MESLGGERLSGHKKGLKCGIDETKNNKCQKVKLKCIKI